MNLPFRASAPVRSLNAIVLPALVASLAACSSGVIEDDLTDPGGADCIGVSCSDPASDDASGTPAEDPGAGPTALSGPAPASLTVEVKLHPGPAVVLGQPTVVSFGAPFAPGALTNAGLVRAFDAGNHELPIHAAQLVPWRVWPGKSGTASIRAARVTVKVTFATRTPMTISLKTGTAPTLTLPAPTDPRAGWVSVTDGEYPSGLVREPKVYATFPVAWLGDAQLHTRTTPVGNATWSWLDASLVGSARTAVNDVPASIPDSQRVHYTTDAEAWLFDRTGTLFTVYARTGDVNWLRRAHRSAQFYATHIDQDGYFDMKAGSDLKYSYGRSLLTDVLLTGDTTLVAPIQRIASAGEEWDPTYDMGTNFWTERHQAYALLAAVAAWEATGTAAHADRADEIAEYSFDMALDPTGSWHADGCMLHGMTAHEGAGGNVPICSPWMSALFADAVWSYYMQTGSTAALGFLSSLASYVASYGLYGGGEGIDMTVPWYLSSSVETFSDDGPWGDVEHTCDVAGVVARGAWAKKQLGGSPAALKAVAQDLLTSCQWNLNYWHRPSAPSSGKTEWRLSPARKFNWWFGTTSDMPWFMSQI